MSDLAEQAAGVKKPRSFILDASVYEDMERHLITREDVKEHRIEFRFPAGLNVPDLRDECRALTQADDFDVMYDLLMQMLAGRSVEINLKCYDGTKTQLALFQVTNVDQDLRGVDVIAEYPCLINWLIDFLKAALLKKYPTPGRPLVPQPTASESGKERTIRTTLANLAERVRTGS
jgi:hypothetical protein